MLILGLLGMYFDAVVVEVKTFLLLFRLALAILCLGILMSDFFAYLTSAITQKISENKSIFNFQCGWKKLSKITEWVWLAKGKNDKVGDAGQK